MINNDSALQLSNVLNQIVPAVAFTARAKRALEIISELAAKQLGLPPQIVFEAILTREKWAVPASAMALRSRMASWKKIRCVPWGVCATGNAYRF